MKMGSNTYMGLVDDRLSRMDQATRRSFFRSKLWERDKGKCGICGERVDYYEMDVDHITPRIVGGTDHWDNLRPAHLTCNRSRGAAEHAKPRKPRKPSPGPGQPLGG